jgi:hypothetical protein
MTIPRALGWAEAVDQTHRGSTSEDKEYSLGAANPHGWGGSQLHWGERNEGWGGGDAEEQCEDEGGACEDEGAVTGDDEPWLAAPEGRQGYLSGGCGSDDDREGDYGRLRWTGGGYLSCSAKSDDDDSDSADCG